MRCVFVTFTQYPLDWDIIWLLLHTIDSWLPILHRPYDESYIQQSAPVTYIIDKKQGYNNINKSK